MTVSAAPSLALVARGRWIDKGGVDGILGCFGSVEAA